MLHILASEWSDLSKLFSAEAFPLGSGSEGVNDGIAPSPDLALVYLQAHHTSGSHCRQCLTQLVGMKKVAST